MNEQYLAILIEAIKGYVHQDYAVVTHKAEFYRQMVTGLNQDQWVISYAPRETKEQKKQRLDIYHERTKDTTNKIRAQFEKVSSVSHTLNIDGRTDALDAALSNFDGKTLQKYIEETNLFYNFIDPNAWLMVYADDQGNNYPIIATSAEAVNYKYNRGKLKYLVVCKEINAKNGTAKEFTLIAAGYQITAREQKEGVQGLGEETTKQNIDGKTWEIATYETDTIETPAQRFGYIADYATNMRTYAGVLDCASSLYKKLINTVSEADLTNALHVFLQKFQVAQPCNYRTKTDRCSGGRMGLSGDTCPNCQGHGVVTHTTVQDIVLVKPADADDEQKYIPLSERIHYPTLPFDIVAHQDAKIEQYPKDISMSIFGLDVTTRPNGNVTATEIENYYDSLNQVLLPFAQNGSSLFEFVARNMAANLNLANVVIKHEYPADFKMMGLGDWLKILNEATTAKASPVVLSLINAEVLSKLTNNNKLEATKQQVLEAVRPFSGLSDTVINTLVNTLPTDDVDRYLFLYADKLLAEVLQTNEALITQPRTLIQRIQTLAKEKAQGNSISLRNNL